MDCEPPPVWNVACDEVAGWNGRTVRVHFPNRKTEKTKMLVGTLNVHISQDLSNTRYCWVTLADGNPSSRLSENFRIYTLTEGAVRHLRPDPATDNVDLILTLVREPERNLIDV